MSLYTNHPPPAKESKHSFDLPLEILIALPIVRECEGLSLSQYLCPANVPTIGYGHVIRNNDNFPDKISTKEAESILIQDLKNICRVMKPMIVVELNPNQLAALLSFTFNVGITAFRASTLLRKINRGDDLIETADQFDRWVYAKGRKLTGLRLRRIKEKKLFLSKLIRENIIQDNL